MVLKPSSRFTYANVVSTAALVLVVIGGGAAAAVGALAPANSVGSAQIINGSIRLADLGPNSVGGGKVKNGSLTASDIAAGSLNHGVFSHNPIGIVQAYAWNNQPTPASSPVTLNNSYVYNSAGGAVTLTHNGTGDYTVAFANLNFFPGNVQVTGYGANTNSCKVRNWGTNSVRVLCFDPAGTATDSMFSLALIK